jgi:hypothetical protein
MFSEKIKALFLILATASMIIFNWMAAIGKIGKASTGAISDIYPTKLTPANYAFSIWGIIYFGLIIFSIYQAFPSCLNKFERIRFLYILSCGFNIFWLYFWGWENIVAAFLIITFLLISLVLINIQLVNIDTASDYWFVKFPLGIYFGWVTVAFILNATIALKSAGFETSTIIASALILLLAFLSAFVSWRLKNYFYPLPIAWAVTAIAIKQSGSETAIVVSSAFAVIISLLASISFVLRDS